MMDEKSRERLERIVSKPATELFDHEISFLRARRAYLNGDMMRKFENVLEDVKVEDAKDPDSEPSYDELKEKAAELGMKKVVGISREKLEAFIDEALAGK